MRRACHTLKAQSIVRQKKDTTSQKLAMTKTSRIQKEAYEPGS
jgi:hypothetical protein